MSKVKIISVFLGSLFLIAALAIGLTLVSKKQTITEKAAPATTLTISPSSQNVYAGQDFSLSVQMNTGSNAVSGMDLNLNFDPNSIQVNSIATGSAILNLTRVPRNPPIDNVNGKIYYSAFSTSTSVTGSNLDVLDINGTVKPGSTPGNKTVGFDNTTAVIALGETGSVLQTKTSGTVVVLAIVAPVITLSASPSAVTPGGSSVVTWSTTGTTSTCTKSNGWTGSAAASGSQTVTLTATKTYTLTCTNSAGSDVKSVTITAKAGDVNGDGVVNVLDIGEIINNYGTTGSHGWIHSDLNKDGVINILDLGIVINNYGN